MEWIVLNVALCFTLVVHFVFSNASSTKFQFTPTASFKGFAFETRQASSKIECCGVCASQLPPCAAIRYNGVTGQCQLLRYTYYSVTFLAAGDWQIFKVVNML